VKPVTILGRLAAVLTVVAVIGAAVAGCGSNTPVTYSPAAYGANGTCYYLNSPAEVTALQNAGLCPRSWVAGPMPLAWEEMYYPYYSSPAYYDTYVPVSVRHVYVTRVTTFGSTHSSAIKTQSARATYKSSTGKTVTGQTVTVSKAKFGSGTVSKSLGGGSGRVGSGTSGKTGSGSVSRSGTSGRAGGLGGGHGGR
jgi:hypothetical protein